VRKLGLPLLLLLPFSLFAQTPTIVTGTVTDINGLPYSNASVSAQLIPTTASPTIIVNGIPAQIQGQQNASADVNGNFSMNLFCNIAGGGCSVIQQVGTQWQITVTTTGTQPPFGKGPQACTATVTITGATQSLTATFSACPAQTRTSSLSGLPGNGNVTTVSSGNLPPLFTTSVATPTTTPAISYSLSNAAANTVFANCTGGSAPPAFCALTAAMLPASGPGSGTVTSFSYAETGIDPLYSATVTNPTSTPQLVETANTVQPGMVLAGPVPTGTATNPTFENAGVNASTVNGTTVSVSGAPAAATSAAIMFGTTAIGQNVPVPDGTWTAFSGNTIDGSHPVFKNLSSVARITPTSTIASSDTWSASLAFLGGSVTSIPQSTPSFSTCGTGCGTTTFSGAVTAGHAIVVYGFWASATSVPTNISASDSVGNSYVLMLVAPFNGGGHFALIAQNVGAGTPTVTVRSVLSVNLVSLVAFELAGPTAYYTGPTGPWQFRYLDPATLAASGLATGISKYFTQNLGADITGIANNSTTTLLTQAVTFPSFGCPCRVSISYGAAVQSNNSHVFETWISDGTNAGGAASQEYVNTGLIYSSTATPIFPNNATATYSNNQSITFTLNLGITTLAAGTVTAKQLSPGGHQATWMQISILPTQN
jgi:hypothetical protein